MNLLAPSILSADFTRLGDAIRALDLNRFVLKYSNGPMPHEHLMRCIDLYGTEVIPRVRRILERED